MRARGFRYGPETSDLERTHRALRPFAELTDDEREQNRHLARAIPEKLVAAGFTLVHADNGDDGSAFPGALLEQLAEDEHARWVRARIADGWHYGPVTDKVRKLHASMIRWRLNGAPSPGGTFLPDELAAMGPGELSEAEREKDRVMIRGIPAMLADGHALAHAGLAVRALSTAGERRPAERAGHEPRRTP